MGPAGRIGVCDNRDVNDGVCAPPRDCHHTVGAHATLKSASSYHATAYAAYALHSTYKVASVHRATDYPASALLAKEAAAAPDTT